MIPFTKMHGLGNDFVVIDRRKTPVELATDRIRAIADRRRGIGCDQLVLIDLPSNGGADVLLRFHNPDGSEAAACGNGTRCVAAALMTETSRPSLTIETAAGLLSAETGPDGTTAVDMGPARMDWQDIPLREAADTLSLPITLGPLTGPTAVSMGNPHCVFFVDDAEAVDLEEYGPTLEHHELFPERCNVEVASVLGPDRLRLRVWERGTGITLACGSGACATAVAANRRGLTGRQVELQLDGGELFVDWHDDGHVVLSGPVATSFTGALEL
jgi:diaminopimelate epimerase